MIGSSPARTRCPEAAAHLSWGESPGFYDWAAGWAPVMPRNLDQSERIPAERLWPEVGLSADQLRARLDILVAGIAGGIVVTDAAGRIQLFNPTCERLFGYAAAEVVGSELSTLLVDPPPLADLLRLQDPRARSMPREFVGRRRDGSSFPISIGFGEGRLEDQSLYVGLVQDISMQKEAQSALREREERLHSMFETGPDAIVVIDEAGRIESLNAAAVWLFGYLENEVLGLNVKMLMAEPHRDRFDGILQQDRASGEKRVIGVGRVVEGQRRDGTTFPMELNMGEVKIGERRLFTGFIRDITERQRAEHRLQDLQAELLHISRLTDMGQMSSALAHELNQPLTALANYVKAARRTLDQGAEVSRAKAQDLLDKAAGQALRAGEIIRRLRGFIEKRESNRAREDVNAVAEEALALALVGAADRSVAVSAKLGSDLPSAMIDKVQIQQVLVNLVRNALEAMAGQPRRELCVTTESLDDRFILVSVADTGPGLSEEVNAKLFQPFVTTKHDGMGIGLSICRSIVDAHGGKLWAAPNPEGGTVFRFQLPVADDTSEDER